MLILLPPSEGKTTASRRAAFAPEALRHPELADPRARVWGALLAASARDDALAALGLPPTLIAEVERNRALPAARADEARRVYSGVLYDALGAADLAGTALARARAHVAVVSALFGLVYLGERIPAYRLSMATSLDGVGPLARFWSAHLTPLLADDAGLVLDARSATYQAAARVDPRRHVPVRVFRESGGRRTVVSHNAKHLRGVFVGALLRRSEPLPRTAAQLGRAAADFAAERGLLAEFTPPAPGRAGTLDLVELA